MSEQNPNTDSSGGEKLVICVGDIHGYYSKLQNLWFNLQSQLNPSQFNTALVIFLGDYCDRGPDTKLVLNFLISLPSKYPNQRHVFLAGNHDIAFSAFLHLLPRPLDGSDFKSGFIEYAQSEEREGWYNGLGFDDMYLQGRRWGGSIRVRFNTVKGTEYKGSIYDSAPTFESYGVPHGSSELVTAVPDEHKKFLADLVWVHKEDDVCVETKPVKLIAVHGGLVQGKSVEDQIKNLKSRDTSVPKIESLSGRKTVWEMPDELKLNPTVVVSGHHGKLHIEGLRLIVDEGGGLEQNPVAAIVLPWMKIIRDTDCVQRGASWIGNQSNV